MTQCTLFVLASSAAEFRAWRSYIAMSDHMDVIYLSDELQLRGYQSQPAVFLKLRGWNVRHLATAKAMREMQDLHDMIAIRYGVRL